MAGKSGINVGTLVVRGTRAVTAKDRRFLGRWWLILGNRGIGRGSRRGSAGISGDHELTTELTIFRATDTDLV